NAAVRRFQIRNALEVTGKLNAETLAALHIGNAAPESQAITSQQNPPVAPPSAPAATPRPNVAEADRNFLRQQPQKTEPPEVSARGVPARLRPARYVDARGDESAARPSHVRSRPAASRARVYRAAGPPPRLSRHLGSLKNQAASTTTAVP